MANDTQTTLESQVADFHKRFDARIQTVLDGLGELGKQHTTTSIDAPINITIRSLNIALKTASDYVNSTNPEPTCDSIKAIVDARLRGSDKAIQGCNNLLQLLEKFASGNDASVCSFKDVAVSDASGRSPNQPGPIVTAYAALESLIQDWQKDDYLTNLDKTIIAERARRQTKDGARWTKREETGVAHLRNLVTRAKADNASKWGLGGGQ